MSLLATAECESCNRLAQKLTLAEIESLVELTENWSTIHEEGIDKVQRTFPMKSYAQAISFTSAIGQLAESQNHHPAILLEYSTVTVTFWTHIINGLHKNDFIMSAKVNCLFSREYKK